MHTAPLHDFFCRNGIASVFGDDGRLAVSIKRNIGNSNPVCEYDAFQAFFDMEDVSGTGQPLYAYSEYLESLVSCFPDALYLFNTGNMELWLDRRKSLYGYLPKALAQYGCDEFAVMNLWAEHFREHTALVERLFQSSQGFYLYDTDRGDIEDLCKFMASFGFRMNADNFKVWPEIRGTTEKKWHVQNLRESALYFYYHLGAVDMAVNILEAAQELQPCSNYYKSELVKWKRLN